MNQIQTAEAQESAFNFRSAFADLITLTEKVLPELRPAEQLIYLHFFMQTVFTGQRRCRRSYMQIGRATNLAWRTVQSVIKTLINDKQILAVETDSSGRSAKTYSVIWPVDIDMLRAYKNPAVLKSSSTGASILSRLNEHERKLLDFIISSLTEEERNEFMSQARINSKDSDTLDERFREIAMRAKFGPATLDDILHRQIQ